eukprot:gene5332-7399_t
MGNQPVVASKSILDLCDAIRSGDNASILSTISDTKDVNIRDRRNESPLFIASSLGQVFTVKALISAGADCNQTSNDNMTPIYIAASYGFSEVLTLLIESKAEVNVATISRGRTALHLLCMANDRFEIVRELIYAKADFNLLDEHGCSPLFYASKFGCVESVQLLIQSGAKVNAVNYDGVSSLQVAASNNHIDIVLCLINASAEINTADKDGTSPLFIAVEQNYIEIVHVLILAGAIINHVNSIGIAPLIVATQRNAIEIMTMLLNWDTDVNIADDYGCTSTWIAAKEGYLEILQLLIRFNADINIADDDGYTPLHVASKLGNVNVMLLLLSAGADVNIADNENGYTALYLSVKNNHIEATQLLLEYSADINKPDTNGVTPLLASIENGNLQILQFLLINNANPDLVDDYGCYSIWMTVMNDQHDMLEELIKYKTNLNIQDVNKNTPFMISYKKCQFDVMRRLMIENADLNIPNKQGLSALHIACTDEDDHMVEFLLTGRVNLDLFTEDENCHTPLLIAVKHGSLSVVNLLINAGANVNLADCNGISPLILATKLNKMNIIERLLNTPDLLVDQQDNYGCTALWIASKNGFSSIVSKLIIAKANINHKENAGITPIVIAFKNFQSAVVELLIESNAEVASADKICYDDSHSLTSDLTPLSPNGGSQFQSKISNKLWRQLVDACLTGNFQLMINLLCAPGNPEININFKDKMQKSKTCLIIAAENGYWKILNLLLLANADPDITDDYARSSLYVACDNGHFNIVKLLLKASVDVNKKTVDNVSPLGIACKRGYLDIANLLIRANADMLSMQMDGNNLLHVAVEQGHIDIVETLIQHSNFNSYLLSDAIDTPLKSVDKLKRVLDCDSDSINSDIISSLQDRYPLEDFPHVDDESIVGNRNRILDINQPNLMTGYTPLMIACSKGYVEIVKLLLEKFGEAQISVNHTDPSGVSALYIACHHGYEAIVQMLLDEPGIDLNQFAHVLYSPLIAAVNHGRYGVVKQLISAGCDVNIAGKNGNTAIICGAYNGHYDIVYALLEVNAKTHKMNHDGQMPLMVAQRKAHSNIITLLQEADKVNHNYKAEKLRRISGGSSSLNSFKETIEMVSDDPSLTSIEPSLNSLSIAGNLIAIIKRPNESISQLRSHLNKSGVDINIQDENGDTALLHAVYLERIRTVRVLLNAGCDVNKSNKYGRSALWFACSKSYLDLVHLLCEHHGQLDLKDKDGISPIEIATKYNQQAVIKFITTLEVYPQLSELLTRAKEQSETVFDSSESMKIHSSNNFSESGSHSALISLYDIYPQSLIAADKIATDSPSRFVNNPVRNLKSNKMEKRDSFRKALMNYNSNSIGQQLMTLTTGGGLLYGTNDHKMEQNNEALDPSIDGMMITSSSADNNNNNNNNKMAPFQSVSASTSNESAMSGITDTVYRPDLKDQFRHHSTLLVKSEKSPRKTKKKSFFDKNANDDNNNAEIELKSQFVPFLSTRSASLNALERPVVKKNKSKLSNHFQNNGMFSPDNNHDTSRDRDRGDDLIIKNDDINNNSNMNLIEMSRIIKYELNIAIDADLYTTIHTACQIVGIPFTGKLKEDSNVILQLIK